MLDLLDRSSTTDLTTFRPEHAKRLDAEADALIRLAKEAEDWPLLEEAVDVKIENQRRLVEHWRETVTPNRGTRTDLNADRRFSVADAERLTGFTQQQVSRWRKHLKDPEKYRLRILGAAYRAAFGSLAPNVLSSMSDEYYTPALYIAAARRVLGEIDLDPASCEVANRTVKATRFYTIEQDGLTQPWRGKVFCNPPYGGQAGGFVDKLVDEYVAGNVSAAIVLVSNRATETNWFQPLFDGTLCFVKGRIPFDDTPEANNITGSVFAYLGNHPDRFDRHFRQFGAIMTRYDG
jgi:hypothetical protein